MPNQALSKLKEWIPIPIRRFLTAPYWWWYNRARHQLAAWLSPRLSQSQRRMRAFKDCHKGKRCFIIGNGPSLKDMDLSPLQDEVTFGMNRIYLLFPELGFETTYYVSINTLVIEQCREDIQALSMPRFITWRGRKWLKDGPSLIFLDTDYTAPEAFSTEATGRIFEGSTVTYVALQIAYYMGFEEVILIGVDHSFTTKGPPNVTVISTGDDQDHFAPHYFGKGFRWQLPDLEASERAYALAKEAFERDGRRVFDATAGGKLQVFPKVDFGGLFQTAFAGKEHKGG